MQAEIWEAPEAEPGAREPGLRDLETGRNPEPARGPDRGSGFRAPGSELWSRGLGANEPRARGSGLGSPGTGVSI